MKVIVIGGGAAGFFAAVNAAAKGADVLLLEKTTKLLSKVRISGGGRCNVTHACFDNALLVRNYPRGEKELRSVFSRFTTGDTIEWFQSRGVGLKTEADGRMFPETNSSETIVNCLLNEAAKYDVGVKTGVEIIAIKKEGSSFTLEAAGGGLFEADRLIIACGGNPKDEFYNWLRKAGHTIIPPAPSLFTFNIPENPVTALMGVSVPFARVRIISSKLQSEGPLLITHWGLSGPAILKASAWGARILKEMNYHFNILVTWVPKYTEEKLRIIFHEMKEESGSLLVASNPPVELPRRLWEYMCMKAGLSMTSKYADLSKKNVSALVQVLLNDEFSVKGKTTFKEEFVTCGGVSLREVDLQTLESRIVPGLFFAGEVLDIDGVTGGFNFQNAWSTAWIAAENVTTKK